jgi:hypothetical protein
LASDTRVLRLDEPKARTHDDSHRLGPVEGFLF